MMSLRRIHPTQTVFAIGIVLASSLAPPAHAQRPELLVGEGVRVWSNPIVVGRVVRANGDTLVLLTRRGETTVVSLSSVDRVDVSTRKDRHALKGAAIGALLGLGSGLALGFSLGSGNHNGGPFSSVTQPQVGAVIGAAGALVGAGIGGVIGALTKTDHWEIVSPARRGLSLYIRLGSGHAGIGAQRH